MGDLKAIEQPLIGFQPENNIEHFIMVGWDVLHDRQPADPIYSCAQAGISHISTVSSWFNLGFQWFQHFLSIF